MLTQEEAQGMAGAESGERCVCVKDTPGRERTGLRTSCSLVWGGKGLKAGHECTRAKLSQPCLTLCDPMDHSPLGSSVHGILLARILELAAMPSSRGSSRPRDRTRVSSVSRIGRWVLHL